METQSLSTISRSFKSLDELYKRYPYNTLSKFQSIARKYGFTNKEAKHYLENNVVHDQKVPPPKFMHIYSKHPNAYQMDTFFYREEKTPYLMIININSRKAYAYKMTDKGAGEVLKALNKFINEVQVIYSIISDQDKAYLSNAVLSFMKDHNIIYRTTTDNDHDKLAIINRFMRTIRDLRDRNEGDILDIVDAYNDMPHRSLGNKAPKDFTDEDERKYIEQQNQNNPYDFQPNEKVRVVLDSNPFAKKRSNVSKVSYVIDSRVGNQFLIKASDGSVDLIPGYKLVRSRLNVPQAQTIKNSKRGIVQEIVYYYPDTNQYEVLFDNGDRDVIPAANLREGNPTRLSRMEREYWIKQKSIPASIRKWL